MSPVKVNKYPIAIYMDNILPLKVWQLLHLSCGTPRRLQCYEPVNKRTVVILMSEHVKTVQ